MDYWLLKSDPDEWAWDDQVAAPKKTTHWDGVRNAQATNHLKAMNKGDRALFYHSGKERAVVGVVEVVRPFYPDPNDDTGRSGMVDVKAVAALPRPVPLSEIKQDPKLAHLPLVRQPRLSVMPIDDYAWQRITQMGEWQGK